jgi:hypothetical protein
MLTGLVFFVDRRCHRRLLFAVAAATLPILLWSPIMLRAPPQSMAWVDTSAGPGRPGLSTLHVLAPAGPFPDLFEVAAVPVPSWASLGLLSGVIACVAVAALRHSGRSKATDTGRPRVSHLALALLPGAALAVLALVGIPVYFAGRTESLIWVPIAALTVVLLSNVGPVVRRVLLGAYVVTSMATLGLWLADLSSRPPALGVEIGQKLAPLIEEGDRIVVVGLWQLEVRHGLAQAAEMHAGESLPAFEVETLPRSQTEHPGWLDREAVVSDNLLIETQELVREARREHQRIWLLWAPVLPLDRTVLPAFRGWQRHRASAGAALVVDLLLPPVGLQD